MLSCRFIFWSYYLLPFKKDIHGKYKGLEDLLQDVQNNLDEFIKLATCVAKVILIWLFYFVVSLVVNAFYIIYSLEWQYAEKLHNIRTDRLDDKKSAVLTVSTYRI